MVGLGRCIKMEKINKQKKDRKLWGDKRRFDVKTKKKTFKALMSPVTGRSPHIDA